MLANQFKSKIMDTMTCVVKDSAIRIFDLTSKKEVEYEAPENTQFSEGQTVRVTLSPPQFTIGGKRLIHVGSSAIRREEKWLEKNKP